MVQNNNDNVIGETVKPVGNQQHSCHSTDAFSCLCVIIEVTWVQLENCSD